MKIYVSGTFSDQVRLREKAATLFSMGHQVTGTWLNEVKQPAHMTEKDWFTALAVKDLAEVAAADCIILDNDGSSTSGGRYTEWGFALGRFNMLKIVVGQNHYGVFLQLADKLFTNWDEVFQYLKENHSDDIRTDAKAG